MIVSKEVARSAHEPWRNLSLMRSEARDDLKSAKSSGVSSTSRSGRSFAVPPPALVVVVPSSFPSWTTEGAAVSGRWSLPAGERSMKSVESRRQ